MKPTLENESGYAARFFTALGEAVRCEVCPQHCLIQPGQRGRCLARLNTTSGLMLTNYGNLNGLALDPMTKKPLYHFYPYSYILSVGSYGCNLSCSFCQNHYISQEINEGRSYAPEELVAMAKRIPHNLGVAFTYNEPLISIEYLLDTAPLLAAADLKVVLVSNGVICAEPLQYLLPYVDAWNIDLKGFSEGFYHKVGGSLAWVQDTIRAVYQHSHVEVTTLIIPDENDSDVEMEQEAAWLASLSPEIPLHLSRFFPRYHLLDKEPTPLATLERLASIARRYLHHVHLGNVG